MRILFSATPALGHLLPLLPLAHAARARGHDAAVTTAQSLSSELDAGIEMLSAGPTLEVLLTEVRRRCGMDQDIDSRPEFVAEFFAGARVDLTFEESLAAAKVWQPDLIVHEYCDFVGPLVAAALRCPVTKLAYGPAYGPEIDNAMFGTVASRYRRIGLEPIAPVAFLDTCPPLLQLDGWTRPAGHQYLRPEPHSRNASNWVAPRFDNPRPTVLVTLGTIFHNPVVLSAILRGLADLNVNILATVGPNGDPAEFDVDPSRVHIERFVPLSDLLTGVSAVVAHGGGGTVLAALSRGLPLVLLPQGADQFLNARQVAFAHAGIVLLPEQTTPTAIGSAGLNAERATPAAIGSALRLALTDRSLRAAAQRVAEEIKVMDPPTRVIDRLNRQFALRKSLVANES
jgi:UDP:flavonoid glycosyltransferase YjiC (YdhE family)